MKRTLMLIAFAVLIVTLSISTPNVAAQLSLKLSHTCKRRLNAFERPKESWKPPPTIRAVIDQGQFHW